MNYFIGLKIQPASYVNETIYIIRIEQLHERYYLSIQLTSSLTNIFLTTQIWSFIIKITANIFLNRLDNFAWAYYCINWNVDSVKRLMSALTSSHFFQWFGHFPKPSSRLRYTLSAT